MKNIKLDLQLKKEELRQKLDIKDPIEETGNTIIDKLNPIKNSLNFEILKNIPDFVLQKDIPHGGGGGGGQNYRIKTNGTLQSNVTDINFTGATYDGNGLVTVTGGGGTSITSTTLLNLYNNLIANSLLVPEAWYLITDYQTVSTIRGDFANTIYTGSVEQIYVQAATTNTIYPEAQSKDYPDESLTFQQNPPIDYFLISNYFESGVDYGPQAITAWSTFGETIDTLGNTPPFTITDAINTNLYFDGTNYNTGNPFNINYNGLYTFQAAFDFDGTTNTPNQLGYYTNRITSTSTTEIQIDLVDLHFSDYANDGSFYINVVDVVNGISYDISDTNLGVDWTFSNDGLLTYIGSDPIDLTNAMVYGYYNTSVQSFSMTLGGEITLLHMDSLTCNILDVQAGNGFSELGFNYAITYNGRIIQRHNWVKDIIIDIDYRGVKFRRYGTNAPAWAGGLYYKGTYVNYGGSLYLCVIDNSTTPGASSGWVLLCGAADRIFPYTNINIQGFYPPIDATAYNDYNMFNLSSLPDGLHIYRTDLVSGQTDICFLNTVDNSTMTISASATVINSMSYTNININVNLVVRNSVIVSGKYLSGFISAMSTVSFQNISSTYIYNMYDQNVGNISNSIFASNCYASTLNYIYNTVFVDNSYSNVINYMYGSSFAKPVFENYFFKATNIVASDQVDNNLWLGYVQGCYLKKMQNCIILNAFSSNTYTQDISRNVWIGPSLSNTINVALQDCFFSKQFSSNVLSNSSSTFVNNYFADNVSNMNLSGLLNVQYNVCFGYWGTLSGADNVTITYNKFLSGFNNNAFQTSAGGSSYISRNVAFDEITSTIFKNYSVINNKFFGNLFSCTFDGGTGATKEFSYNTFFNNCSTNTFTSTLFSLNTVGGLFSNNSIAGLFSNNYITDIVQNLTFSNTSSSFQNNIITGKCISTSISGAFTISNNNFKSIESISGTDNFQINRSTFHGTFVGITFNAGANASHIDDVFVTGNFSYNVFNDTYFTNNNCLGLFDHNTLSKSSGAVQQVKYNNFNGDATYNTLNGDIFNYNTVGTGFYNNTQAAGVTFQHNEYPESISGFTLPNKANVTYIANSVGIGTTNPTTVQVMSKDRANGSIYVNQQLDGQTLSNTGAGNGLVTGYSRANGATYFGASGGYSNGSTYWGFGIWANPSVSGDILSGAPNVFVDKSGNVGIGTTTPGDKLEVLGDIKFGGISGLGYLGAFGNTSSSGNIYIGTNIKNVSGTPTQVDASQSSWVTRVGGGSSDNFQINRVASGGTWGSAVQFLTINASGNVGIGTTSPTNLLSLGGNSARTFWMERHTTSNTAGNNLTIQAGGATVVATNKAGGNLILTSGVGTGTGTSDIIFNTNPAGSTGTTDTTPTEAFRIKGNTAILVSATITTVGTTGDQTINKVAGRVNIAAAGTTITVTNSLVDTNSIILAVAATADTTARVTSVVASNGSFVINTVACTAETAFNFLVMNPRSVDIS